MIKNKKDMAENCFQAFQKLPSEKRKILHCPIEGNRTAHAFCYYCQLKNKKNAEK
jgi:hypothetical protein